MEIMRVDLEEKIRKLEEDRHNSDISAGMKHNFLSLQGASYKHLHFSKVFFFIQIFG